MAYSGTFLALGLEHGDDEDNQARREAAGVDEGRDEEERREAECGEEEQRDATGAADRVQSQA